MAIYHASVKIISRSAGRSAVAAAAYRSASEMTDERTGEVHDYARKGGVTHSEIIAPEGAPAWATNRAILWNAVEAAEKRKDSQLAREVEVALPRELSHEQQVDLVRAFVRERFVAYGMVADFSIHNPKAMDGEDQPHAHIMLTMRRLDGAGFGKKATEWNPDFGKKDGQAFVADTSPLMNLREAWAGHVNGALERAGRDERVDHRTLAAQQATAIERGDELAALTLDRRPEPKIGPVAMQMVREGRADEAHAWQDVQGVRQERQERRQLAGQVIDMARAARELVERQAQRLAALGGRLEDSMSAFYHRAFVERDNTPEPAPTPICQHSPADDPKALQAQQDRALPESEVKAEWRRLFEQKFGEVKARAERLIERCTVKGRHYRDLQSKHIGQMPSPQAPTGWFSSFKVKAWEKERADWSEKNTKLCASISHHEKRGVRLSDYTKQAGLYDQSPSRGERLSARALEKERPHLAERMESIREKERQRQIEQRREAALERFQKQREDRSNSRGRGGHGRG